MSYPGVMRKHGLWTPTSSHGGDDTLPTRVLVTGGAEELDELSEFTTGSSARWTPAAGTYYVQGSLELDVGNNAGEVRLYLRKNLTVIGVGGTQSSAGTAAERYPFACVCAIVQVNGTDDIVLEVETNTPSNSGYSSPTGKITGYKLISGQGEIPFSDQHLFAARRTTDQTATGQTVLTLLCNTEDLDPSSWYDTSTGRFTPQVGGWYMFFASARTYDADTNDRSATFYIRKNGTTPLGSGGGDEDLGATRGGVGCTVLHVRAIAAVFMNGTTDYVDVAFQHLEFSGNVTLKESFFCGHRIQGIQ